MRRLGDLRAVQFAICLFVVFFSGRFPQSRHRRGPDAVCTGTECRVLSECGECNGKDRVRVIAWNLIFEFFADISLKPLFTQSVVRSCGPWTPQQSFLTRNLRSISTGVTNANGVRALAYVMPVAHRNSIAPHMGALPPYLSR